MASTAPRPCSKGPPLPLLCRFGNRPRLSRSLCSAALDLKSRRASLVRMAKLARRRRSFARAVIAGFLVWLLALQGFAFAASPHGRFALTAAGPSAAISQISEICSTQGDEKMPAPGRHDHCPCCILCPSGHAGGLAWIPAKPVDGIILLGARIDFAFPLRSQAGEPAPPAGWISSWSQRAPPRRTA